jgi:hypothetical protein
MAALGEHRAVAALEHARVVEVGHGGGRVTVDLDGRVGHVVHVELEEPHDLGQPGLERCPVPPEATDDLVVAVGVRHEDVVEQVVLLGVDGRRVAVQHVVDLDPVTHPVAHRRERRVRGHGPRS